MQIVRGVHAIPGTQLSRVYLIEDAELTLIDAGMPWSAKPVFRYIERIGRRPSEISRILMTHSHPDHAGGAPRIRRVSGAQVVAHQHDTRQHRRGGRNLHRIGAPNALNAPLPFLRRTPVERLIADGDLIPVASGVRIIHTPGHTPGSVCFLLQEKSLLFSGDTIFSDGRFVSRSLPFPGYASAQYRQSLERLAAMSFDVLCGGHGVPLIGGASDMLRALLKAKPDPPTWSEFAFRRLPHRLAARRGVIGEDH